MLPFRCAIRNAYTVLFDLVCAFLIWKEHWTKMHQNEMGKNLPPIKWHLLQSRSMREEKEEMKGGRAITNDPLCLSFCHIATTASFCCSCRLVPRFSFCFDRWFSYQLWVHFKQIFSAWKHTNNRLAHTNEVECTVPAHRNFEATLHRNQRIRTHAY